MLTTVYLLASNGFVLDTINASIINGVAYWDDKKAASRKSINGQYFVRVQDIF